MMNIETLQKSKLPSKNIAGFLTTLLHINNSRIARCMVARRETKDPELIALFSGFIQTSRTCKEELRNVAHSLGELILEEESDIHLPSHNVMEVRREHTTADRIATIDRCVREEWAMLESYRQLLRDNLGHITSELHALVTLHNTMLGRDFDKVISLQRIILEVD